MRRGAPDRATPDADDPPLLARATVADAEAVHALLADAGAHLATQGFRNWIPPYPLDRVRHDIATREVWLARRAGVAVATFMLGAHPHRPYDPSPWTRDDVPALYLNRIAVAPAEQGRGVATWCLRAILARGVECGAHAVRCDVLAANLRLRALYERHGFVARGERAHSGWTFTCYERVLP